MPPNNGNSPPATAANGSITDRPERIVFVDDRLQNCMSVLHGLRCADVHKIPIVAYHYVPDEAGLTQPHSQMSPTICSTPSTSSATPPFVPIDPLSDSSAAPSHSHSANAASGW